MHRWNRAVGDMSLVLVSMVMVVGPLARLWPRLNFLLPWRRELGIHAIVLAAVHTFIILVGWIEWDFMRLVGFEFLQSAERYVMLQHGFALANIVGIVALLYGTVLAVSSNNRSLKILGGSAWKFVQQGAYVLWVLVLIHTAYFLYLHFLHFHRPVPEPNWGQGPFAILVLVVFLLQAAAFIKTWRGKKERARA
ncbi:MAG: ferric reductase-like transmembrane domain-containing protein [Rhodospirillaceae bacterium]|nr:ferric reductase-like transmembrane domain-containing protein [Rhodospirillaceae bacterium]